MLIHSKAVKIIGDSFCKKWEKNPEVGKVLL
jgi:hypothetical protein